MDGRLEIALYALVVTIIFQIVMMVVSLVSKRRTPAMPLIEFILRSFSIGMIDKLNRPERSDFALIFRGTIVFFIIFACLCGISYALHHVMLMIGYSQYTHVVLLFLVLSPIMVLKTAYTVSVEKPAGGAYLQLSRTLNQNLIPADKHGLRRTGCKAMAVSLTEYIIAPLLFYILGGVICAYLYVSLSLFVRLSGQNSRAFTSVFTYIYKAMNFVASIIGVILIFLSSLFATGGRPLKVLRALNVETAMAYAQNITLGGSFQNRMGETIKDDWVGSDGATAQLDHKDVLRVMIQYGITVFILIAILAVVGIYT